MIAVKKLIFTPANKVTLFRFCMKKLLLLALLPLFIACKKDSNRTPDPYEVIEGRWYMSRFLQEGYRNGKLAYQSDGAVNGMIYYEFKLDLTGTGSTLSSGRRFTYTTDGKTISFLYNGIYEFPRVYTIKSLSSNEMHLSKENGSNTDYNDTEDIWFYR
jgi:hypothetical protein